jgi:branched-subunit amino acid aminotransferase/4-amino-4-deoxychorismate lyase
MPAQSPLPERQHRDLGLIETMLWTRESGIALLPLHLTRLTRSAAALRFPVMIEEVVEAVQAAVANTLEDRLRLRLVVKSDGSPSLVVAPEPVMPEGALWRVAIAERRLDPADPLIRHKTTARQHYDEARAIATAGGAEEAVFLNGAGEVCEGAITSVFVEREGVLLTPALECGLLPGVLRESLIGSGKAQEARLKLAELAGGFYLGNAVRGLVRARLAEGPSRRAMRS